MKYYNENKNRKLNVSGQDERELEEALKRSLAEMKAKGEDVEGMPEENKQEEEPKFQAFTGQGVSLGGTQ